MGILLEKVQVTTTGSSGSATGYALAGPFNGFLLDVFLDYNPNAPATTDVTLTTEEREKATLLTVADNATDGLYTPMRQACDSSASAITGVYVNPPLTGQVRVAVAGCDALVAAVTAWLRILES